MSELLTFDPTEHPHRRWNPLQRNWVLCSPHRTKRPWQGQEESPSTATLPEYDPKCYLCPGNSRSNGGSNEAYDSTYIFENDFAAVKTDEVDPASLIVEGAAEQPLDAHIFRAEPTRGKCHVICFNPKHSLTLAELSAEQIKPIIKAWQHLYTTVSSENPWIQYTQLFENKGAAMGCSNPHPHGQSWSLSYVPTIARTQLDSLHEFSKLSVPSGSTAPLLDNGKPSLLLNYAHSELQPSPSPRVIFSTNHFVALVPYWALWPFEVMVLPYKRQIASVIDLTEEESVDLAETLRRVTCRLDNIFKTSFPYSMGIYQAPSAKKTEDRTVAQLYFSFYPPLLRSATVRKFLVGFELFAEAQRDLTPEQGAAKIKAQPEVHYKHKVDQQ